MKKGFTLIELLAVIVILGIISSIAVVSYNYYLKTAAENYYKDAVKTMKGGAESLITYCATSLFETPSYCVDVPSSGNSVTISLSTLMDHDFVKQILDDKSGNLCSGDIVVTNNTTAGSINTTLDYKVCLRCDSYTSSDCQ